VCTRKRKVHIDLQGTLSSHRAAGSTARTEADILLVDAQIAVFRWVYPTVYVRYLAHVYTAVETIRSSMLWAALKRTS
jgi:hypothetical protein